MAVFSFNSFEFRSSPLSVVDGVRMLVLAMMVVGVVSVLAVSTPVLLCLRVPILRLSTFYSPIQVLKYTSATTHMFNVPVHK